MIKVTIEKQEGKIINLGSCPVSLSNTAGTEGRIEVDGTDKVEADKPYDVYVLDNDWTVVTRDHSLCSHYEHTVLITDGEPEILTIPK